MERFPRERFAVVDGGENPDAILCRSAKIDRESLAPSLKAIARAGAGTDKICVEECSNRGIPVFNTPGANANSVKELVMLGLLLASREVIQGVRFVGELAGKHDTSAELTRAVEKEKKRFAGIEIKGKTIGIVGLGAIGSLVADMALSMGMEVLGFDTALSVDSAWKLSNKVKKMENLATLLARSDFLTLHVPMMDSTRHMINAESLALCKKGVRLLNFSREGIVDPQAVKRALEEGRLSRFVSDFPYRDLVGLPHVISIPHLGASTQEAEDNCAVMASDQLIDFLENGNIENSVNFPNLHMERTGAYRFTFTNLNVPTMLKQVLALLADSRINVSDMTNKSRERAASNIIDTEQPIPKETVDRIEAIEGIHIVRTLPVRVAGETGTETGA